LMPTFIRGGVIPEGHLHIGRSRTCASYGADVGQTQDRKELSHPSLRDRIATRLGESAMVSDYFKHVGIVGPAVTSWREGEDMIFI